MRFSLQDNETTEIGFKNRSPNYIIVVKERIDKLRNNTIHVKKF